MSSRATYCIVRWLELRLLLSWGLGACSLQSRASAGSWEGWPAFSSLSAASSFRNSPCVRWACLEVDRSSSRCASPPADAHPAPRSARLRGTRKGVKLGRDEGSHEDAHAHRHPPDRHRVRG